MRIDRLLGITVLLLNRDRITARELAERFEVSVRTVYRDLETINTAGIPVVSYTGNQGGYGILDTFRIDRQVLTFGDVVSLVSTLRAVNSVLENRELDAAVEKIANLLPRRGEDALSRASERIVIDILPMGYTKKQKDRLADVHRAVSEQRLIRFAYCNNRGENTVRTVEPMTLIFKGGVWYLFAFCRLKSAYRLFRLSRMSDSEVLDETFQRREESFRDIFASNPAGPNLVELELRFSPEVRSRVEDFFDPDQIRRDEIGHMRVDVVFPEDEWVYAFLLGFGEHLEVLYAGPHTEPSLRRRREKYRLFIMVETVETVFCPSFTVFHPRLKSWATGIQSWTTRIRSRETPGPKTDPGVDFFPTLTSPCHRPLYIGIASELEAEPETRPRRSVMNARFCQSCGMPLPENDQADYCRYCTDENGKLKPREAVREGIAAWLEQFTPDRKADFRKRADSYLNAMPAWAEK